MAEAELGLEGMVTADEVCGNGDRLPLVESFYTVQGEGLNAGRAAYFIRLAGCNVHCPWCDAKYTWNESSFEQVDVVRIADMASSSGASVAVITGGEPLVHHLDGLCGILKSRGFEILLETSGSRPLSGCFDWICVSPKRKAEPLPEVLAEADELKVVISSEEDFHWAERNASGVGRACALLLQPEWDRREEVLPLMIDYVKRHPKWRISLQTHKYMDIP